MDYNVAAAARACAAGGCGFDRGTVGRPFAPSRCAGEGEHEQSASRHRLGSAVEEQVGQLEGP